MSIDFVVCWKSHMARQGLNSAFLDQGVLLRSTAMHEPQHSDPVVNRLANNALLGNEKRKEEENLLIRHALLPKKPKSGFSSEVLILLQEDHWCL